MCSLTADVADNYKHVGTFRERAGRRCKKFLRIALGVHKAVRSKMCLLYLPAVICPSLMGYTMHFLMDIWELRRKFSEYKMLQQFLVGSYQKTPMLPSVRDCSLKGSPGKGSSALKFPCALILATLRSIEANRAVLTYYSFSFPTKPPFHKKKCLKVTQIPHLSDNVLQSQNVGKINKTRLERSHKRQINAVKA